MTKSLIYFKSHKQSHRPRPVLVSGETHASPDSRISRKKMPGKFDVENITILDQLRALHHHQLT
jgi:hypothetical protein